MIFKNFIFRFRLTYILAESGETGAATGFQPGGGRDLKNS